jgi:hypothetical protein
MNDNHAAMPDPVTLARVAAMAIALHDIPRGDGGLGQVRALLSCGFTPREIAYLGDDALALALAQKVVAFRRVAPGAAMSGHALAAPAS